MNSTNWSKALTYSTNINALQETYGEDRVNTILQNLLKAGGTFGISQGMLYTSDFSSLVLKQLLTDWQTEDESAKMSQ